MALPTADQALIAFKHVFAKPHTSPNFQKLANEAFNVGFSSTVKSIFAETVTSTPTKTYYWNDGIIEYVRLELEYIPGTNTANGFHGFQCKLPSDYQANTTNPRAGVFPFTDGSPLQDSGGLLQVIPEVIGGNDYIPELFTQAGSKVFPLDVREWVLYPFGGIVFQNNPPASGANPANPGFLDAFIYIGHMTGELLPNQLPSIQDTVIANTGEIIHSFIATQEKSVVYDLTVYKENYGSASYEVRTTFDYQLGSTDIVVNNTASSGGLIDVTFSVAFNNMDIEITLDNNDLVNDFEVSGVSEFLVTGFSTGVEIPTDLIVTDPNGSEEVDALAILTQSEYDALSVKNPNTIYFIQ
jgi:hypothetical protein